MHRDLFAEKRAKLLNEIEEGSVLILFSGEAPHKSADYKYEFTVNKNFYYFTGIDKEKVIMLITKNNNIVEEMLFIEKSDPVLEKWVGKKISEDEAREISGIQKVFYIEDFNQRLGLYLSSDNYKELFLDLERNNINDEISIPQKFANEIIKKYPALHINNIYNKISAMRVIKSEEEIELIRKAISITKAGIERVLNNACECKHEYEIEAHFGFAVKANNSKYGFLPIVASGANAPTLHYEENSSEIAENSLVLIDVGAEFKYYSADISRTFPINGKFTARQKELYNIVLKAEIETIKAIKPGLPFSKLNEITKSVLAEECKKIGLIKEAAELSKYYYHGVSHYLGLDVHDTGNRQTDLKAGMLITVEPGLYIEEECIGIRIEDDVIVTENGYEVLSKDIIKTVEEIEKFMQK